MAAVSMVGATSARAVTPAFRSKAMAGARTDVQPKPDVVGGQGGGKIAQSVEGLDIEVWALGQVEDQDFAVLASSSWSEPMARSPKGSSRTKHWVSRGCF
jgi:hypothetical protein